MKKLYVIGPDVDLTFTPEDRFPVRVGNSGQKCVVFLGVEGPNGIEYGGTGFLCGDREEGLWFPLLVTCRHVAAKLENFDQFFIRANTRDGGAEDIPLAGYQWRYHDDPTVDLAMIGFSLPSDRFEATHYDLSAGQVSSPDGVAPGDNISIIGLFRLHAGSARNLPFVHTGNISVLADKKELVPIRDRVTNKLLKSELHLIEAQTLDGLSGSPVFIHDTVLLGMFKLENGQHVRAMGIIRLFGIYSGSWDGEPGTILADDRNLKGDRRVPVGVGTVVPFEKIMQLVRESAVAKAERAAEIKHKALKNAAGQDSSFPDAPGHKSTDENPTHREDFMRLASAAARTQKPDE